MRTVLRARVIVVSFLCLLIALHAAAEETTYILSVGLRYPGFRESLSFTTRDALATAEIWERLEEEDGRRVIAATLVDDADGAEKPTRETLLQTLGRLSDAAAPGDRLLFFFAGHGLRDADGNNVLALHGGTSLGDAAAHIRFSDISEALSSSSAELTLGVVDACHSGGGLSLPSGVRVAGAGSGAVAWLFSCAGDEQSREDRDTGSGLFTRFFHEAISSASDLTDVNQDGQVSLAEIHAYTTEAIAAYLHAHKQRRDGTWLGVTQTPQAKAFDRSTGTALSPTEVPLFRRTAGLLSPDGRCQEVLNTAMRLLGPRTVRYACGSIRLKKGDDDGLCEAIECLYEAAVLDDVSEALRREVYFWLGRTLYEQGDCQDLRQAVKWFRRAREIGCAEADVYLGHCAFSGAGGIPRDQAAAQAAYRAAAEMGSADASYSLAAILLQDDDRTQRKRGLEHLRRAVRKGHAEAEYRLAVMKFSSHNGPERLVRQDIAKAFELFLRSAGQGYVQAQIKVADCYQYGWGTRPNPGQAAYWRMLASEK